MSNQNTRTVQPPTRTRTWVAVPVVIFAALAALFAFALKTSDPSKLPSTLLGKPVPDTAFAAIDGLTTNGTPVGGFSRVDLAKGEVSIVNFWASWCSPCVEEHPILMALKEQAGVPIYGVNYKDQAEGARRFLGRYGNPFSRVGVDPQGRGAIEWGVYGMPETFVVDGKGLIAYKHVGPLTPESLTTRIVPAIEAARRGSGAAAK